jgi:hypothetical protein
VARWKSLLGLVLAFSLVAGVAPQGASARGPVRAVLDGRLISLEKARSLSCHDFDLPILTCFRTAGEMEAAAAARASSGVPARPGTATGMTAGPTLAATTVYVVVYVDGGYAGNARALSQDDSYLGDIGWNDVISSLRSYGASGHFWENAPSGGFIYYFYPTTQVTYVGDYYNDKFSAVYFN